MNFNRKYIIVLVLLTILTGCHVFSSSDYSNNESIVVELKLNEETSNVNAEFSGLCWYDDMLVMLPQYPSYFRQELGKDVIFLLDSKEINKAIKKNGKYELAPKSVEVVNNKTYKLLPGYEGFESICYDGEFFYLTVEYNSQTQQSILVKAQMINNDTQLEILNEVHYYLDLPSDVFNASFESSFTTDDYIYVIYEANGALINKKAIVKRISKTFSSVEDLAMDSIEYRITDVTRFNQAGEGWAINYLWPGDVEKYKPSTDYIANPYSTINNFEQGVERIIPLKLVNDKLIYDNNREPVYIKKEALDYSSNWEGIVNYKDGFLIVTDKFPKTIFKYIEK